MDGLISLWNFIDRRMDEVLQRTMEHATYMVSVFVTGTLIAVSLGILFRHRAFPRELSLGVASVLLTLPSLALFVMLIPVVGIGFMPPYIALTMYSLLPIMRNTVVGLHSVDKAVLESARGMGMSARQRLWKIEFPLAWPVILTGIRVATLMITGIAAIATLVGGGGLGAFINLGLGRLGLPNSMEAIWAGSILIILLALIADSLFMLLRRATTSRGIR